MFDLHLEICVRYKDKANRASAELLSRLKASRNPSLVLSGDNLGSGVGKISFYP